MRILVVGASGFLARHLVPHLRNLEHEIEPWSRGPAGSGVDLLGQAPLPPGDWDVVFHLAGHSRPGLEWPRKWVSENLEMTHRLVEHLTHHSPGCRLIFLSSAHVYEPREGLRKEGDPLGPASPYGLSKLLCEDLLRFYAPRLETVIVRSFNLVGPGMAQGLLIPDLIARLKEREDTLQMRGMDSERDFLDVRDAIEALGRICNISIQSGEAFNLASGKTTRVSHLVHRILGHLGIQRPVHFEKLGSDQVGGDPAKLIARTGWAPVRSLEESVPFILADA